MERPHVLYAVVVLVVGLAFVGSYTYFRYEEIQVMKAEKARIEKNMMDQEQQRAYEKALEKMRADQNEVARSGCFAEADMDFDRGLRLNASKNDGRGNYTLPVDILGQLRKQRSDARELCLKMYPAGATQ